MARTAEKLESTYCITATIHDYACHDEHCHNTTTYIRDCDTYNGNCDDVTTHLDIHNSTGWSNTTRSINACYSNVADQCGDTDIIYHSCTNDDCRNRTTHIHACYSNSNTMSVVHAVCGAFAGLDANPVVRAYFDAACVDRLLAAWHRRFGTDK